MRDDDMDFFDLKYVRVKDAKNDDLFEIESADYETLKLSGDQLIDLFLQILCWQWEWHTKSPLSPTYIGDDNIRGSIEMLLEYYGGPDILPELSGGAQ
jgi:hypothetical protein